MRNGKYTAILIDDENWTRDVLRHMGKWDELGIDIIAEASDGEYGLELIISLEPDIIVSDVKMPNLDGLTLLDMLRKRGCQAKVLYVSGYNDFPYIRTAIQLKANDYLLKPIKPEELNKQLERCVRELEQEQGVGGQKELSPQIILRKDWFAEYMDLRMNIYETMWVNNIGLLEEKMNKLEQIIVENEGDDLPSDIAIYIYCDFHNVLHRFISNSGYRYHDLFDAKTSTCVFGNDFSFHEMFQMMGDLLQKAVKGAERLRKEKNRIDIKAVCKYVDGNYTENITLEQTADKFYVSKEYLSKVFKEETGVGFISYIRSLRMKKAKELLLMDSVPIKDIVEMTGYKETGHFYKVFKKYYGTTPGEMLQDIKNIQ